MLSMDQYEHLIESTANLLVKFLVQPVKQRYTAQRVF